MKKFLCNNIVFIVFFGVACVVLASIFVVFLWGFRVTGYYLAGVLFFLFFLRMSSGGLGELFAARNRLVDVIMLLCGIGVLLFLSYYAPG